METLRLILVRIVNVLQNLARKSKYGTSDSSTTDNIVYCFDELLILMEKLQNHQQISRELMDDAMEDVVDTILILSPRILLEPELLSHSLLNRMFQYLLDTFEQWRQPESQIELQRIDIFLKVILIIIRIAEVAPITITNADRQRRNYLLKARRFVYLVRDQIDEIANANGIQKYDPNINIMGFLAREILSNTPFSLNFKTDNKIERTST